MSNELHGVLVALATPYSSDGSIDHDKLKALVDRTIDGGVNGVVACGSTGECSALTSDERRDVVETVVEHTAGRVPVIAQTGSTSTAEAIKLSQHAEESGADVVMPVAPFYEALTMAETKSYLRKVASSVQVPVMLYNIPAATGVNLEPAFVGKLASDIENIKYIKNTTNDMAQSAEFIHNYSDVVGTFVGWDSLAFCTLASGAAGIMAGTANVVPAQLAEVYSAFQAGDLAAARAAWEPLFPLLNACLSVNFVAAVKTAMDAVGFPLGDPREPFDALSGADAELIRKLAAPFRG